MTPRETLYRGASCAAWGYFFLYFDINLGRVNILPEFVAYALFLYAISLLEEERRELKLLRPLGWLLLGWSLLDWVGAWFGFSLEGGADLLQIAGLVMGIVQLYFHFQQFTDFAAIAAKYQGEEDRVEQRILCWRSWQTVFLTITLVMMYLDFRGDLWETLMVGMAIVGLITGLCAMMALFALRKLFAEGIEADS